MYELPKSSKQAKIQSTFDEFKGNNNIMYVAIIEAAWSCVGLTPPKAYRVHDLFS